MRLKQLGYRYGMDILKILGGVILASLGFAGIAVAVMRYFIGQMQEILYLPLDLSINFLMLLGVISLLAFVGGVYIILRYGQ